jgi:hypothetical protein
MGSCGFPAQFSGNNGQYRRAWFCPFGGQNHYDGLKVNDEYSPERLEDGPK